VLYVGADDGKVYAFDVNDGAERSNFPFDTHDGPTKGFVFPDFAGDRLYFATVTTVWAVRDVGPVATERWSHSGIPDPSIVVYPPGSQYLWVGSSDGRLYQIDVTTGNPAQAPDTKSVLLGSGAAGVGSPSYDVIHKLVYVGTEDGSLYAVAVPF
jgi:outer membrane protein assembly factor BamB